MKSSPTTRASSRASATCPARAGEVGGGPGIRQPAPRRESPSVSAVRPLHVVEVGLDLREHRVHAPHLVDVGRQLGELLLADRVGQDPLPGCVR